MVESWYPIPEASPARDAWTHKIYRTDRADLSYSIELANGSALRSNCAIALWP